MSNLAFIGDPESALPFIAIGFDAYGVSSPEAARELLHGLAKQSTAVIFITEALAEALQADILLYQNRTAPSIILVPAASGSSGLALSQIDALMEKAVGMNLLKEKEEVSS